MKNEVHNVYTDNNYHFKHKMSVMFMIFKQNFCDDFFTFLFCVQCAHKYMYYNVLKLYLDYYVSPGTKSAPSTRKCENQI